jgi:Flp pilus assembly protein TadG
MVRRDSPPASIDTAIAAILLRPLYYVFIRGRCNGASNSSAGTAMPIAPIITQSGKIAKRFIGAAQGNIAPIFAIVILPILGFTGAAIDYTRVSSARTSMQAALDSTALMLSKDLSAGSITAAQIQTKAQGYFTGLYTNKNASNVSVTATYTASSSQGSTIEVDGSATMTTDFLKIAGFPQINFNSSSTTAWGITKLRVAMALDNTGSMADAGKIGALQTASKNLIDQLSATAVNNGDVYISIVPFANVVNLGTSFTNSGFIDWSNWSTSGSIEEGWTCGSITWGQTMKCGSSSNSISKWNGCVMDRGTSTPPGTANGPDVEVTAPTSSANYYPADQSSYCPQQVAPLSYNWSSLKSTINAMTPSGGTNQPIGLVWAWQTLQQSSPMNAPAEDPNYTYKKVIILLSDGLNTMDRWPAYGNGSTQFNGAIDSRQGVLCSNIKNAGVEIYTIQVNTGGDPTSTILQSCATDASHFFMLTSASEVISTFNTIGTSLSKLHVAR